MKKTLKTVVAITLILAAFLTSTNSTELSTTDMLSFEIASAGFGPGEYCESELGEICAAYGFWILECDEATFLASCQF
jgi:hypothetical protein